MRIGRPLICFLLCACTASADDDRPVRIQLLDGRSIDGSLLAFDATAGVTVRAGGQTIRIALSDVDWLDIEGPPCRSPPGGFAVRLADGSFLPVEVEGGSESGINVRHDLLGRLQLPLDRVREITIGPPRTDPAPMGDETDDGAWLNDGTAIHGIVTVVSDRFLVIQADFVDHRLEWTDLRRLTLAPSDARAVPPTRCRIHLSDDSVLAAAQATIDDQFLTGQTACDIPFRATVHSLRVLEPVCDSRTWLEDVEPHHFESIPLFDVSWPIRVGRNALGGPLQVGGRRFRRGIGLHAACRVAWRLDRRYDRFRATVAVDDDSGSLAHADIAIRLDDRVAYQNANLRWKAPPSAIDLDVSEAARMEIEIGFGRHGDTQDRIDLLNPRLIVEDRKPPPEAPPTTRR
jgi:hypothetical protein